MYCKVLARLSGYAHHARMTGNPSRSTQLERTHLLLVRLLPHHVSWSLRIAMQEQSR